MNPLPFIVGAALLLSLRGNAMVWPVNGVVTSTFESPERPTHNGIDIAAPVGSPIVAPLGGIVSGVLWTERGGNTVLLEMDNNLRAGFAHLRDFAVVDGQRVERGEVLGAVGVTGNTTGPHLHFTLKDGDQFVNPLDYLPALA